MSLISLTHLVAIGSTACKLAAEIARKRDQQSGTKALLNIIPMDSDTTSLDELPEELQQRFLMLPTERGLAEQAARDPNRYKWTHALNDPRAYEPPRKGLGFQHQPRNCLIAMTAAAPIVKAHIQRWRRDAIGRIRSEGRDGVQTHERWVILFEPYGATGWGWIVVASMLRLDDPSARIDALMTLPDQAIAGDDSLLEYRAKAYDFFASMWAADNLPDEFRLHPELTSFPVDLLLVSNPGRNPEVGSLADHTSVLVADTVALIDGYAHFETQWINCHQLNLSEKICTAPGQRRNSPLRVVPFGAVTYRHDPEVVAGWLQSRTSQALAEALSASAARPHLAPFLHKTLGRLDELVERQRQRFNRSHDLQDWLGSTNRQNFAAKRGQLGPAIQGLLRSARKDLEEISIDRDTIVKAVSLDADLGGAIEDVAQSIDLLESSTGTVRGRLEEHEREIGRAEEFFTRRAGVASPAEIQEALRARATAELTADLLRGILHLLEEISDLVSGTKKVTSKRLAEVRELAAKEPAALSPPGLGEEHIVTERLLHDALRDTLAIVCSAAERGTPLQRLLESDCSATEVLNNHSEAAVSHLVTRSASEWARLRFPTYHHCHGLVQEVASRLQHVDLLPAPGVPAQKHLWVFADDDLSSFRDDLMPHIGGSLNHQGKQPSSTLDRSGTSSRLIFLSVWLGIGPHHLKDVHDESVAEAWQAMRRQGFGFAITAQPVPELPWPEIPAARHERPLFESTTISSGVEWTDDDRIADRPGGQETDWFTQQCQRELRRLNGRQIRIEKTAIN